MNIRTYPDPPTPFLEARRRYLFRRRLVLTLIFSSVLMFLLRERNRRPEGTRAKRPRFKG